MTFVAAPHSGQLIHTPRAVVYTNTHTHINTLTHSYTSKYIRILIDNPQNKK